MSTQPREVPRDVVVRLEIPESLLDQYETQAKIRKLPPEVVMEERLSQSVEAKDCGGR